MKLIVIGLLFAAGLILTGLIWLSPFLQDDVNETPVFFRWLCNADCDERWMSTMSLLRIQATFAQFPGVRNKDEREAFRNVKTLDDLWAIFQKRHQVPEANHEGYVGYMVDGWGRPFVLSVTNTDICTIINISCSGPQNDSGQRYFQWVELTVADQDWSVRGGPR